VALEPLASVPPQGRVQGAGSRLAEHVPLCAPPFVPEHVHETELPADGNDVVLGEPLEHCEYGLYPVESYAYDRVFAVPQAPVLFTDTESDADADLFAALVQVRDHVAFPVDQYRAPVLYDVPGGVMG
jgi:hypothetical protein